MKSKNRTDYRLTNDYVAEKVRSSVQKNKKAIERTIEYSLITFALEYESNRDFLNPSKEFLYDLMEDLMNESYGPLQQTAMRIQIKSGIISNVNGMHSKKYTEFISCITQSLVYVNFFKDVQQYGIQGFLLENNTLDHELILQITRLIKRKLYQLPQISILVAYSLLEINLGRISRNFTFFEKIYQYSQGEIGDAEMSDYLSYMGRLDQDSSIVENLEDELDEIITETLYCTIIQQILAKVFDIQQKHTIELLNKKLKKSVIVGTVFDDNRGYNTDGGQFLFDQFSQFIYEYNKVNKQSVGEIFSKFQLPKN